MILEVEGVTKGFGGIRAVDRCSLGVQEKSITALIGPNGAGKSTLFNLVAGVYAPDEGAIRFRGDRIDGLPPYEMAARGLVKTFQIPREFGALTVLENVMVAAPEQPGERPFRSLLGTRRVWDAEAAVADGARAWVEFVGLGHLMDEPASHLSGGQRKLLELARALMVGPDMILLDEPVAGVNPIMAAKLMDLIEQLRGQGRTFFLVEHDMDVVMRRCDRVIVMHEGRTIAEGRPAEIQTNPAVLASYLGA